MILNPKKNTVYSNSIIIDSGTIQGNVYGGYTFYGVAFENSAIINSGTINGDVIGGESRLENADSNNVTINGGTIKGSVYGSKSYNGGGDNNNIIINGGTINGGVNSVNKGNSNNNTVTYNGGVINGGINGGGNSGNKLIIGGKGLGANSISSFQEYLFSLPANIKANDIMLKLTKPLTFNDSDKLEMNTQGKLDKINLGDTITLVNNVANNYQGKYYTLAKYKSGVADYYYGFDLSLSNKQLTATLINNNGLKEPMVKSNPPVLFAANNPTSNGADDGWENWGLTLDEILEFLLALDGIEDVGNAIEVVVSEESKSLSEGATAAMATLNSASDTIAGKATENAMANSGNSSLGSSNSIGSFGAIGAGANRYKTGSYVDSRSVNLVAGIALGKELNYGKLVVGPFLEFGYSDYETHNDFSSGHVKGDGDSKYYGIGALTRFDFNDFKGSRPYLEFSARFGRNKNDFSNDIGADYDVSSNYYGLHAGLGYIIANGANKFDIYAKYFFTRLNSADTTLATGENFAFDAVKSHKTRLGVKYSREIELANGNVISPYIGAGWEKEYSGDAKATTTPAGSNIGFAVTAPSLKGNSAMAEIGINIGKDKGFKADIGLTGYAGIHRGVNANLMLQYEF